MCSYVITHLLSLICVMPHLPSSWHLGTMQTCWQKQVYIQEWNIKPLVIFLFRNIIVYWEASWSVPCVMNVDMVWDRSREHASFTDEMGTWIPFARNIILNFLLYSVYKPRMKLGQSLIFLLHSHCNESEAMMHR
jgi:hypothetical protein